MTTPQSASERFDLESAYAQLQAHLEAEHWVESIAACYRILNVEPTYRDVSALLERARKQLALERERTKSATEAWRGTLAPVMGRSQSRPNRWLLALLVLGLTGCSLSVVAALFLPSFREQLPIIKVGSEPGVTATPAQLPSAPTPGGTQAYVSTEGRFFLQYPQGWMVRESPSEGQSLRAVIITPEAIDEPERITIIFGPGGGQSAEQVWITVLGFMQAMHDEDAEDWLLGEAVSTSIGGYHARQIPFHYRDVKSETDWQGLIAGLVRDSVNYAFVTEAPVARWQWAWPLFQPMLNSVQFH